MKVPHNSYSGGEINFCSFINLLYICFHWICLWSTNFLCLKYINNGDKKSLKELTNRDQPDSADGDKRVVQNAIQGEQERYKCGENDGQTMLGMLLLVDLRSLVEQPFPFHGLSFALNDSVHDFIMCSYTLRNDQPVNL